MLPASFSIEQQSRQIEISSRIIPLPDAITLCEHVENISNASRTLIAFEMVSSPLKTPPAIDSAQKHPPKGMIVRMTSKC